MNYKKVYENLIIKRKLLNRTRKRGDKSCFENHHILPKSLGGTNEKENLVLLTPKEHYIAHLLLVYCYEGDLKRKMIYALAKMNCVGKTKRKNLTASQYDNIRKLIKENGFTQEHKNNLKHKKTPEHIKKIIESRKRNGNCNNLKGHIKSEQTRKNLSRALMGHYVSKETCEKIRQSNSIKVFQYDLKGNFIKEFKSITIATKETNSHNIHGVLKGKLKTSGGFVWCKIKKIFDINYEKKKIFQYDIKGNFIKKWENLTQIKENFPGNTIIRCINGKQKSAYGFLWVFENETVKIKTPRSDSKSIFQFDLNGNFIKRWNSIGEAKKEIKSGDISGCLNGRTITAGGYIWKYENEIKNENS